MELFASKGTGTGTLLVSTHQSRWQVRRTRFGLGLGHQSLHVSYFFPSNFEKHHRTQSKKWKYSLSDSLFSTLTMFSAAFNLGSSHWSVKKKKRQSIPLCAHQLDNLVEREPAGLKWLQKFMRPNMAEFLKFLELCHTLGTAFKISPTQPWLNPYTFGEVACTFPQSGRCIVALLSPVGHFSVDLRQS